MTIPSPVSLSYPLPLLPFPLTFFFSFFLPNKGLRCILKGLFLPLSSSLFPLSGVCLLGRKKEKKKISGKGRRGREERGIGVFDLIILIIIIVIGFNYELIFSFLTCLFLSLISCICSISPKLP